MADYVEEFTIGGRAYGIEKKDPQQYQCWVGGCGIAVCPSMPEARARIHEYAVSEQRRKLDRARSEVEDAMNALDTLGDDPFNLGKFFVGD